MGGRCIHIFSDGGGVLGAGVGVNVVFDGR